jgi:hypothetical protein
MPRQHWQQLASHATPEYRFVDNDWNSSLASRACCRCARQPAPGASGSIHQRIRIPITERQQRNVRNFFMQPFCAGVEICWRRWPRHRHGQPKLAPNDQGPGDRRGARDRRWAVERKAPAQTSRRLKTSASALASIKPIGRPEKSKS